MKKIILLFLLILSNIVYSNKYSLDYNDYGNNPNSSYFINQYVSNIGNDLNNPDRFYNLVIEDWRGKDNYKNFFNYFLKNKIENIKDTEFVTGQYSDGGTDAQNNEYSVKYRIPYDVIGLNKYSKSNIISDTIGVNKLSLSQLRLVTYNMYNLALAFEKADMQEFNINNNDKKSTLIFTKELPLNGNNLMYFKADISTPVKNSDITTFNSQFVVLEANHNDVTEFVQNQHIKEVVNLIDDIYIPYSINYDNFNLNAYFIGHTSPNFLSFLLNKYALKEDMELKFEVSKLTENQWNGIYTTETESVKKEKLVLKNITLSDYKDAEKNINNIKNLFTFLRDDLSYLSSNQNPIFLRDYDKNSKTLYLYEGLSDINKKDNSTLLFQYTQSLNPNSKYLKTTEAANKVDNIKFNNNPNNVNEYIYFSLSYLDEDQTNKIFNIKNIEQTGGKISNYNKSFLINLIENSPTSILRVDYIKADDSLILTGKNVIDFKEGDKTGSELGYTLKTPSSEMNFNNYFFSFEKVNALGEKITKDFTCKRQQKFYYFSDIENITLALYLPPKEDTLIQALTLYQKYTEYNSDFTLPNAYLTYSNEKLKNIVLDTIKDGRTNSSTGNYIYGFNNFISSLIPGSSLLDFGFSTEAFNNFYNETARPNIENYLESSGSISSSILNEVKGKTGFLNNYISNLLKSPSSPSFNIEKKIGNISETDTPKLENREDVIEENIDKSKIWYAPINYSNPYTYGTYTLENIDELNIVNITQKDIAEKLFKPFTISNEDKMQWEKMVYQNFEKTANERINTKPIVFNYKNKFSKIKNKNYDIWFDYEKNKYGKRQNYLPNDFFSLINKSNSSPLPYPNTSVDIDFSIDSNFFLYKITPENYQDFLYILEKEKLMSEFLNSKNKLTHKNKSVMNTNPNYKGLWIWYNQNDKVIFSFEEMSYGVGTSEQKKLLIKTRYLPSQKRNNSNSDLSFTMNIEEYIMSSPVELFNKAVDEYKKHSDTIFPEIIFDGIHSAYYNNVYQTFKIEENWKHSSKDREFDVIDKSIYMNFYDKPDSIEPYKYTKAILKEREEDADISNILGAINTGVIKIPNSFLIMDDVDNFTETNGELEAIPYFGDKYTFFEQITDKRITMAAIIKSLGLEKISDGIIDSDSERGLIPSIVVECKPALVHNFLSNKEKVFTEERIVSLYDAKTYIKGKIPLTDTAGNKLKEYIVYNCTKISFQKIRQGIIPVFDIEFYIYKDENGILKEIFDTAGINFDNVKSQIMDNVEKLILQKAALNSLENNINMIKIKELIKASYTYYQYTSKNGYSIRFINPSTNSKNAALNINNQSEYYKLLNNYKETLSEARILALDTGIGFTKIADSIIAHIEKVGVENQDPLSSINQALKTEQYQNNPNEENYNTLNSFIGSDSENGYFSIINLLNLKHNDIKEKTGDYSNIVILLYDILFINNLPCNKIEIYQSLNNGYNRVYYGNAYQIQDDKSEIIKPFKIVEKTIPLSIPMFKDENGIFPIIPASANINKNNPILPYTFSMSSNLKIMPFKFIKGDISNINFISILENMEEIKGINNNFIKITDEKEKNKLKSDISEQYQFTNNSEYFSDKGITHPILSNEIQIHAFYREINENFESNIIIPSPDNDTITLYNTDDTQYIKIKAEKFNNEELKNIFFSDFSFIYGTENGIVSQCINEYYIDINGSNTLYKIFKNPADSCNYAIVEIKNLKSTLKKYDTYNESSKMVLNYTLLCETDTISGYTSKDYYLNIIEPDENNKNNISTAENTISKDEFLYIQENMTKYIDKNLITGIENFPQIIVNVNTTRRYLKDESREYTLTFSEYNMKNNCNSSNTIEFPYDANNSNQFLRIAFIAKDILQGINENNFVDTKKSSQNFFNQYVNYDRYDNQDKVTIYTDEAVLFEGSVGQLISNYSRYTYNASGMTSFIEIPLFKKEINKNYINCIFNPNQTAKKIYITIEPNVKIVDSLSELEITVREDFSFNYLGNLNDFSAAVYELLLGDLQDIFLKCSPITQNFNLQMANTLKFSDNNIYLKSGSITEMSNLVSDIRLNPYKKYDNPAGVYANLKLKLKITDDNIKYIYNNPTGTSAFETINNALNVEKGYFYNKDLKFRKFEETSSKDNNEHLISNALFNLNLFARKEFEYEIAEAVFARNGFVIVQTENLPILINETMNKKNQFEIKKIAFDYVALTLDSEIFFPYFEDSTTQYIISLENIPVKDGSYTSTSAVFTNWDINSSITKDDILNRIHIPALYTKFNIASLMNLESKDIQDEIDYERIENFLKNAKLVYKININGNDTIYEAVSFGLKEVNPNISYFTDIVKRESVINPSKDDIINSNTYAKNYLINQLDIEGYGLQDENFCGSGIENTKVNYEIREVELILNRNIGNNGDMFDIEGSADFNQEAPLDSKNNTITYLADIESNNNLFNFTINHNIKKGDLSDIYNSETNFGNMTVTFSKDEQTGYIPSINFKENIISIEKGEDEYKNYKYNSWDNRNNENLIEIEKVFNMNKIAIGKLNEDENEDEAPIYTPLKTDIYISKVFPANETKTIDDIRPISPSDFPYKLGKTEIDVPGGKIIVEGFEEYKTFNIESFHSISNQTQHTYRLYYQTIFKKIIKPAPITVRGHYFIIKDIDSVYHSLKQKSEFQYGQNEVLTAYKTGTTKASISFNTTNGAINITTSSSLWFVSIVKDKANIKYTNINKEIFPMDKDWVQNYLYALNNNSTYIITENDFKYEDYELYLKMTALMYSDMDNVNLLHQEINKIMLEYELLMEKTAFSRNEGLQIKLDNLSKKLFDVKKKIEKREALYQFSHLAVSLLANCILPGAGTLTQLFQVAAIDAAISSVQFADMGYAPFYVPIPLTQEMSNLLKLNFTLSNSGTFVDSFGANISAGSKVFGLDAGFNYNVDSGKMQIAGGINYKGVNLSVNNGGVIEIKNSFGDNDAMFAGLVLNTSNGAGGITAGYSPPAGFGYSATAMMDLSEGFSWSNLRDNSSISLSYKSANNNASFMPHSASISYGGGNNTVADINWIALNTDNYLANANLNYVYGDNDSAYYNAASINFAGQYKFKANTSLLNDSEKVLAKNLVHNIGAGLGYVYDIARNDSNFSGNLFIANAQSQYLGKGLNIFENTYNVKTGQHQLSDFNSPMYWIQLSQAALQSYTKIGMMSNPEKVKELITELEALQNNYTGNKTNQEGRNNIITQLKALNTKYGNILDVNTIINDWNNINSINLSDIIKNISKTNPYKREEIIDTLMKIDNKTELTFEELELLKNSDIQQAINETFKDLQIDLYDEENEINLKTGFIAKNDEDNKIFGYLVTEIIKNENGEDVRVIKDVYTETLDSSDNISYEIYYAENKIMLMSTSKIETKHFDNNITKTAYQSTVKIYDGDNPSGEKIFTSKEMEVPRYIEIKNSEGVQIKTHDIAPSILLNTLNNKNLSYDDLKTCIQNDINELIEIRDGFERNFNNIENNFDISEITLQQRENYINSLNKQIDALVYAQNQGITAYYNAKITNSDNALKIYKTELTKTLIKEYSHLIKYDNNSKEFSTVIESNIIDIVNEDNYSAYIKLSNQQKLQIKEELAKSNINPDSVSKETYLELLEKGKNGDIQASENAAMIFRYHLSEKADSKGNIHESFLLDYDVLLHEGFKNVINNPMIQNLPITHPNGRYTQLNINEYVNIVKALENPTKNAVSQAIAAIANGEKITIANYGTVNKEDLDKWKPLIDSEIVDSNGNIDLNKLDEAISLREGSGNLSNKEKAELEGLKMALGNYAKGDSDALINSTVTVVHGLETLFNIPHTKESNFSIVGISAVIQKPSIVLQDNFTSEGKTYTLNPSGYLKTDINYKPIILEDKIITPVYAKNNLNITKDKGVKIEIVDNIPENPNIIFEKAIQLEAPVLQIISPVKNYKVQEFEDFEYGDTKIYTDSENIPVLKLERPSNNKSDYIINLRLKAFTGFTLE